MESKAITLQRPTENKSAQIRKMFDSGVAKADIARALGVRYQYVRNVLVSYETGKKVEGRRGVPVGSGNLVSLTISLPIERESFLLREAATRGISADDMLAQVLADYERGVGEQRLAEAFERIASQQVGNFATATPAHEAQRRAFKELNG